MARSRTRLGLTPTKGQTRTVEVVKAAPAAAVPRNHENGRRTGRELMSEMKDKKADRRIAAWGLVVAVTSLAVTIALTIVVALRAEDLAKGLAQSQEEQERPKVSLDAFYQLRGRTSVPDTSVVMTFVIVNSGRVPTSVLDLEPRNPTKQDRHYGAVDLVSGQFYWDQPFEMLPGRPFAVVLTDYAQPVLPPLLNGRPPIGWDYSHPPMALGVAASVFTSQSPGGVELAGAKSDPPAAYEKALDTGLKDACAANAACKGAFLDLLNMPIIQGSDKPIEFKIPPVP